MGMNILPIIKWAGGKNKMLKHYKSYMPVDINIYSEPFIGGGAVFLYIMKEYNIKKAYINDSYEGLINIYQSIKSNKDEFIKGVDKIEEIYLKLTKEDRKRFYYDLRYQHAYDYKSWNKVKEACVLFFLMRTGFNGILQINKNTNNRFGTPCGLLNEVSCVYDKRNIEQWSNILQRVIISCGDYKDCPVGDFVFLDPPYRDSFTTYGTKWGDNQTEDIIKYANDLEVSTFLANRDDGTDFFSSRLSQDFTIQTFPVSYTAGRRKKVDDKFESKKAIEILAYKFK
jgi:DNA adenine methylase